MRCCDCEFRKNRKEKEPDNVAFKLCGTRLKKLIEAALKKEEKKDGKRD